jgi:ATP-dependent exoDNAse (exonuclease V) alpha subunit
MTENPYRLARDIRGIGFKTADAIAMRLGIAKTAMVRVRAGISYALTAAMDEGHCGLPAAELVPLAVELRKVPVDLVQTALLELAERTVVADTVGEAACIFLAGLYRTEQVIAERLLRLVNGKHWPYSIHELQAALDPAGERKVKRFGWTFAPGDNVMQIENDYDKDVYNGDIGYIDDVDPDTGELTASFDGRAVTYDFGELDTLVPAYAATIHKTQDSEGSEYPADYAMLQRNLFYTGVPEGGASSSWLARRRPSPLPCATSSAGGGGRN